MKVASLFSGVGGFDLAAKWVGWSTRWYSEVEPFASRVMAARFPEAVNHGDIRSIKGANVEPVDLICGGFPCQDISAAGRGAGLAGARSGLWSEFARLIGEIHPSWVVAENVSALRSRGLGTILQDLHALGYDAEWHCIPAAAVGAPHQRDRIWIVAHPHRDGLRREGVPQIEGEGVPRPPGGRWGGEDTPGAGGEGGRPSPADADGPGPFPPALPGVHRGEAVHGPRDVEPQRRSGPQGQGPLAGVPSRPPLPETGGHRPEGVLEAGPTSGATHGHGPRDGRDPGWWVSEPNVGRVVARFSSRMDRSIRVSRLHALGNALVPTIPYLIFQMIARANVAMNAEPKMEFGL